MKAVIFDLDGTLADTSGDLLAAANHCFRDMGLGDLLGPGDAGIALRGGKRMLTEGLKRAGRYDQALVDQHYPALLEAYSGAISTHTRLFPGVLEAIAELKADGIAVGICTNKPEQLADQLLREMGIRGVFAALVGADTLPVRKPNPEPLRETARRLGADRYLLVGDSDTDHNTARAAGVPSVLVAFGPSGEDMAALQPDALLADYARLPALAARHLA